MTIDVSLPIPPAACHQNARVHWAARSRAAKQARQDAYRCALSALDGRDPPRIEAAVVHVQWFGKDRRCLKLDPTNCQAALKASIDGLTDAGMWTDDRAVKWGDITIGVDAKAPRVDIAIEPAPAYQSTD